MFPKSRFQIDLFIFLPAAFLLGLGSMVLSSVSQSSFPQHFIFIALAAITFFIFNAIDLKVLRAFSPYLYGLSLLLLLATLLFGAFVRGASRWIVLGPISIQASEITKPLLILFFAHLIESRNGYKRFLWATAAFLPAFILVFIQPDLGSSIVLAAGFIGILFFGQMPLVWLGAGLTSFLVLLPVGWRVLADYQKQRILSFISPASDPLGAGYNSLQAMIAVGSGGFLGKGLGQGTQSQLAFLPERHTDFIFAALSEELGFLGAFLVVLAFFVILYRIITILKDVADRAPSDLYTQSLLGAIFLIIFTHVTVNIGMNLGILPVTGIPLPFVSSGGSALVSMSALLGIVSGISIRLKTASIPDIILP